MLCTECKWAILFFFLLLGPLLITAQERQLQLEDSFNAAVYPARDIRQAHWLPLSNQLLVVKENAFYLTDPVGKSTAVLCTLDELNKLLNKAGMLMDRMPLPEALHDSLCGFVKDSVFVTLHLFNSSIRQVIRIPGNADNIDIQSCLAWLAYTVGENLFIQSADTTIQITVDTLPGLVNGKYVHRREFGITKGTFWSPSGKYLAYYHKDETMVPEYPLTTYENVKTKEGGHRYPMAGTASHQVRIGVYDLERDTVVYLNTGLPQEQYLTNITWGPEEQDLYVAVLNRDQNQMKLNRYKAATGAFDKTLFEEHHEKYVEPEHGPSFLPAQPGQFIWFSERDGFDHLYLYDTSGALISQLTGGDWVVTDFFGTDRSATTAYFAGTKDGPLEQQIYAVNMESHDIKRLTQKPGTHVATFNSDKTLFTDELNSTSMPYELTVRSAVDSTALTLDAATDPLADYTLGETRVVNLTAADGTPLYGRLILPPGMKKKKKYPVIVYVYGGPHAQLVTNSWLTGSGIFLQYLATQGYIVFTLDNRGSANRGRHFEQSTFRQLGTLEVQDQLTGIDYLKTLPQVDPDRMGVYGWSYGGFMTISLMLKAPEVFKVGVAGGPVTDWRYYEIMYGERYMDTPQDNPDGYQRASCLNKTEHLRGKLLLIHGDQDDVVLPQHSLKFLKECIRRNKPIDFFLYPGQSHNILGADRLHLMRKIKNYFDQAL